jgi:hypothetical protein
MNPAPLAFNLHALLLWQKAGMNTNEDKKGEAMMTVGGSNRDSGGQRE